MADVNVMEVMEDATLDPAAQVMVVEEPVDESRRIPGSDAVIEVEEEQAARDTDWENDQDHSKFIGYIKDKIHNRIPRHSGQMMGCERAISHLKGCQNELRTAIRSDTDGKIDELEAEQLYKDTQEMIDRLQLQIDKLRTDGKKSAKVEVQLVAEGQCERCGDVPTWHDVEHDRVVCLMCESEVGSEELTKVANTPKITVFVSAFERAIVGSIIDSAVSNGKNIEDTFDKLNEQYKFTDREVLSIKQTLADYGFPCILDRAKVGDQDTENNGELARNYSA